MGIRVVPTTVLILAVLTACSKNDGGRAPRNGGSAAANPSTASPDGAPGSSPIVRLVRFSHDGKSGKLVIVESNTAIYELTCDTNEKSCMTPSADTDYEYVDHGKQLDTLKSFIGEYPHGDTVGLVSKQTGGGVGMYALVAVSKK